MCSATFPSQVVCNSYSFQSHFLFLHVNKLNIALHSSTFSLDASFQTTVKISNNWLRQCVGKAENFQENSPKRSSGNAFFLPTEIKVLRVKIIIIKK